MNLTEKLITYANNNLNVIFIGEAGVGKTTIARNVIQDILGLRYVYFSAATLDPWAQFVGIPKPNEETNSCDFYRPKILNDAEAIFFDELNRAHPRVLNAVMEIIQFKTINGEPLKNLRFIWAAINPPTEDYSVEDLDLALIDRFHCYIKMKPSIDIDYMSKKFDRKVATVLHDWWTEDLSSEQRKHITPRRVEYMGCMIKNNIPWKDAIPQGFSIPHQSLDERLKSCSDSMHFAKFDKDFIMNNKEEIIERIKDDFPSVIKMKQSLLNFLPSELFEVRDILEIVPKEWLYSIKQPKMPIFSPGFKRLFIKDGIDWQKEYPNISSVFNFENI